MKKKTLILLLALAVLLSAVPYRLFVNVPPVHAAGITRVQYTSNTTNAATISVSWPAATTAGNLLVAILSYDQSGKENASTPPTNTGNAWTLAVTGNVSGQINTDIYYTQNASSQSGSHTWTLTSSQHVTLILIEYSGVALSSALDKTANSHGNVNPVSTGNTTTTTQATELAVGAMAIKNNSTFTLVSGGFSKIGSEVISGTNTSSVALEKFLSATGTTSQTANASTAANWGGAVATFVAANAGVLDHFAISSISSPRTAGTAITSVNITAQDVYNNTVSSFTSNVTYGGTAGITGTSANFTAGVLTGVSVTPTVSGTGMTFIVTGSGKSGTATFDVNPAALDHFNISTISSPQTAGTAITGITLTAQDVYSNNVTSFTSNVTYSGTAGITGTSANFTAGVLTGVSVTPAVSGSNLTFVVTGSGKSGTATFNVNSGALDHFTISTISSPQTAGTAITGITLTAKDVNSNNVTSFTSNVTYGGTAGITGNSANFTAGVLTGVSVTPTVAGTSMSFNVTSSGKSGTATFNVNPGSANATMSTLTPASANITVSGTQLLTVTAKDVYGNLLTSGGSTVTITQSSGNGTISSVTDNGNGTYTANVTGASTPGSGVFIATLGGQPVKSGTGSQTTAMVTYTVGSANATMSILTPTTANITANGTSTQLLTVTAKDVYGNLLTSGGSTVTITKSSGNGTISSVTDNGNGTYTATVTSATSNGNGVFVATLDGNPVKSGTGSQTQATINYIGIYTLTYTAGSNGSLSGNTTQTVNYNGSGTAVTAVPNTGYHFVNWSDAGTANPRTDTNVTANITVTANFAANTYTLTYTAGSNGSLSGNTTQTVNYNGSGTAVTAVPNTGYHFVNWSDASTANPRTDTNVTANITVTANFAINTYTLTYTAGSNGTSLVILPKL